MRTSLQLTFSAFIMVPLFVVGLLLGGTTTPTQVLAGEISGGLFGECDLGRMNSILASNCTWKPSSCSKPSAPFTLLADAVDSYNFAVDEYNFFLAEVNLYLQCIVSEAQHDISTAFPALVTNSVEELSNEITLELDSARLDLEISGGMLQ